MTARLRAALCAGFPLLLATCAATLRAQSLATSASTAPAASRPSAAPDSAEGAAPIRDNSFLVEEAYNQDAGTVQHINAFTRRTAGDWAYALTEEWAVGGQRHQLGATLTLARVALDSSSAWGPGDVAVNYRHQLVGLEGGAVAVAPRLSVLLPTGASARGLGAGLAGVQIAIPVSVETGALVTHFNASVTRVGLRRVDDARPNAATIYALGQSFVWLARRRINLLTETVWTVTDRRDDAGVRRRDHEVVISPGVRWAHDLPHGLQIVPGVALPIGVGRTGGDRALLLYLSFEHSY